MKTCIIYHSYSGITRGIAERVQAACGGRTIEVQPKEQYSKLTAYTIGCYRAVKGTGDAVEPAVIDVSADDVIVIGTPVWAGRATPPVNGAVAALTGCSGKPAVIFATCGIKEGETLTILKKALEAKGMKVAGEFVFTRPDIADTGRVNALIAAIQAAGAV